MSIELFNLQENEKLVSPCITIHGSCSKSAANAQNIQVQHPQLPTLNFPINAKFFKATIILTPGENKLTFVTDTNAVKTVTCFYTPQTQNKPVHLCLLVAKDSPLRFDSPASQIKREGGNGIDLAIKKLRIGARLMQAFTDEQMLRNGLGRRTIPFLEEYTKDTEFRNCNEMRNNVKVHVITVDKTTKEIRDHDVAQQNSKGKNTGALFGWAMDTLKNYGGPFAPEHKPAQAACIFLDSHWDGKLITGHAALGGGDDRIKLAIFGSHGIYSWPTCMEDIVPYFLDSTKTSLKEVGNDCNECGSHWECLTVTLGAFMHEVGHSLGSPHQVNGVMLRDYTRLNRSFLTKENYSLRTNSYGSPSPIFPKEECTWNRMDLLRYLFHPSFSKDIDFYDPSFMRPSRNGEFKVSKPSFYPMGKGVARFASTTGIYLIEVVADDLARGYIEYIPKSLGGKGPQKEVIISLDELRNLLPPDHQRKHGNDFNVRILACNSPDLFLDKFPPLLQTSMIAMNKYGFNEGIQGIKSPLLGNTRNGTDIGIIPFDVRKVISVRVYHGGALDGIRFSLQKESGNAQKNIPAVPPRNYLGKIANSFKSTVTPTPTVSSTVLFGKETQNYTDCVLEPNEIITGFNVRCGAWIDAIQILTSHGRVTEMFGNKNGGSLAELIPPTGQYILGVYGRIGRWVDGIGIVYGAL